MPCDSSYLERSAYEEMLQHTAKLDIWARKQLQLAVPAFLVQAADDYYGYRNIYGDMAVKDLCAVLKNTPEDERNALLYDAHSRMSRDLANWWEEHQKADKERIEREQAAASKNALRTGALAKLTPLERMALGLGEFVEE